jgi:acyl carrier protein
MSVNDLVTEERELVERVQGVVRAVLTTAEDVPLDAPLADVGVNSLSFIRMVVELERACEMRFEDDDIELARFESVADVVRYVAAARAAAGAGGAV